MKHFYKNLPIVKFIGVLMLLLASISRLEAASFWTDANNYDISWYSPETDEYSISTPQQLAGVAYLVNHGCFDFINKTISLTEDIDLSEHLWIPIGNGVGSNSNGDGMILKTTFKGSLNGNNHTISGLTIDVTTLDPDMDSFCAVGLFGYIETFSESIDKIAEIYDLKIKGASISMHQSTEAYKYVYIGTLAGSAYANIHDVTVESTIEFLPSNLFTQISAGGVTGYGNVTNCTFDGSISIKSDSDSFLGGITGTGGVTNCINTGDLNMYGVFATVGGIVGKGGADACINKGNILVKGEGSESLGYGFSSDIGGIAGNGSVLNSGNYGNIDSELYAPLIGSNTVMLGAVAGGYLIKSLNCYNFGSISSKTHNAGLENVNYLPGYYGDDDQFLSNSYSFISGNGVFCGFSNKTEEISESYLKSEEFLELLNKNAISIIKSTGKIAQNWITGKNGFPILSGDNLYPLKISGDFPSEAENEYGSTFIKGTWEDPNISVGEIKINGECFHKGDKVDVTVIPSEGFIFDEAILSYYEFPDTHYISFKSEDLDNNSFSFEMLPHICDLQFRFSSDSGVTDIEIDTDEPVSIYSTDGNLLHKGLIKDAKLNKGIYIVKTHNSTQKILVR
ncbi:MAG: hypothetical protein K2I44_10325 [Muribaculaceae bacterium]|nr:hypothetical protein [Muribaculaceae bacterium]